MKADPSISTPSVHLDFARGLAALVVLLNHARALFFVNYEDVQAKGLPVRIFYLVSGFGFQAVMVFFVLSGYFISSSVLRARREGRWSWRTYAVDRGTRIYVVLIPALVLTLAWDLAGLKAYPQARAYHGVDDSGLFQAPIAEGYAAGNLPAVFVGNVLCLETILVPPLGTNPVLWSLSNEVLYYLMFPLAVGVLATRERWLERLASAVLLVGLCSVLDGVKWFCLLIWCLGVGVAATGLSPRTAGRSIPGFLLGLAVAAFGIALLASRLSLFGNEYLSYLVVGLTFVFVLLATLLRPSPCASGLYQNVARRISGFSYSLYLLHLPLLVFLKATLLPQDRWQPDLLHFTAFLGVLALVVSYAAVCASVTEAKTGRVRSVLLRGIGGGRAETGRGQDVATPDSPGPVITETIAPVGNLE